MSISKIFSVLIYSQDFSFLAKLMRTLSTEVMEILSAQNYILARDLLDQNKDHLGWVVIDLGDGNGDTIRKAFMFVSVVRAFQRESGSF